LKKKEKKTKHVSIVVIGRTIKT